MQFEEVDYKQILKWQVLVFFFLPFIVYFSMMRDLFYYPRKKLASEFKDMLDNGQLFAVIFVPFLIGIFNVVITLPISLCIVGPLLMLLDLAMIIRSLWKLTFC